MTKLLITLSVATLLAGCANTMTPRYDSRFGEAVRQARQMQTINPNPAPVEITGIDGRSAADALEAYHETFRKPPEPAPVINIGGAIGGGK